MNQTSTECVRVDINVFPTAPPPPPPVVGPIPEKLLKIMRKYKYNWRLDQLSKPKHLEKKFIAEVVEPLKIVKVKLPKLDPEKEYYADQQSIPLIRWLVINKKLYGKQNGKKYRKTINRYINKGWGSIYNFYKKRERDRRLRQRKREAKKEKRMPDFERFTKLAIPKRLFKPQSPTKSPAKIFSNFDRLDVLATPKPFVEEPVKRLGVNPAALTYEPTETVIRLAQIPARLKNLPKPLEPGKVQKSALRYKVTPRIETLAVPKQRNEKAKVDEDYDPWTIPPNVLKYKATPRILELAKPTERS
ncbi:uncharacterized protein isoform X2 [Leptinotarsa decemlineata]|uniref:uncharacterized protein isoform X2 n=1 Tax=Leptinotarsa decemlineata TaxID=7539 RepID=UPI003D30875E